VPCSEDGRVVVNTLREHATSVQARRNSQHLLPSLSASASASVDMVGHERGQLHHRRGSLPHPSWAEW
jgi:hypothetical protein